MNVRLATGWLHCALLCALSQAALAVSEVPSPAATDEPVFAAPTRIDRVGRILAPVMIDGKGPFRFLLDTGANYSVVSPQLAQSLGLVPSEERARWVHGVTGSAKIPTVRIVLMKAGDLPIDSDHVPVIASASFSGADGVLGVAGLQHAQVFVDFRHDRVVISRSRYRADPATFLIVDADRLPDGLLTVDARIRGVRALAVIDTGAERTLGNLALRDALRTRGSSSESSQYTDVYGATVEIAKGESERSNVVRFGEVTIKDVEITFGDFHIFEAWDLQSRPAMLIGMDVLGVLDTLVIDFRRQQILVGR